MNKLPWALGALLWGACASAPIPAPDHRPPVVKTWEAPTVTLVVPLRLGPLPLKAAAEAAVPTQISDEGKGVRTLSSWFLKHDWNFWWDYKLVRSPLKLVYQGGRVRVSAGLTGDLNAHWDTLPGDMTSEVEASTGIEAQLTVDGAWKVHSLTSPFLEVQRADIPIGINWDGNFFGETINIADSVRRALVPSLQKLSEEADRRLALFEVKTGVEALWNDLGEARALPGGLGWLVLRPQSLAVGPLGANPDGVELAILVTCRPQVVTGAKPEALRQPLPAAVAAGQPQGSTAFQVPLTVSWEAAGAAAWTRVQALGVLRPSGAKFTPASVTLVPDGDRVMVRLAGKTSPPWPGPASAAEVWLTGRPAYDPEARAWTLADLAVVPSTLEALKKQFPWLADEAWASTLGPALGWPLGPDLDRTSDLTRQALGGLALGPRARWTAALGPGQVADLALDDRGFSLLVRFEGTVGLAAPAN